MSDKEYGDFIVNVMKTLEKNGFPKNQVSLPLEKMYEVAHSKGINFNKVLEFLKEKNIDHKKTNEKIIFFEKEEEIKKEESPAGFDPAFIGNFMKNNPDILKGFNPGNLNLSNLMENASEILKNITPDQLANIQKAFSSMDEKDRQKIMDQAKKMGIFKD